MGVYDYKNFGTADSTGSSERNRQRVTGCRFFKNKEHCTWDCASTTIQMCRRSKCGSGVARESGVSVEKVPSDTSLSRASPLPQGRRAHDI